MLIVFKEKLILKQNPHTTKQHGQLPSKQRVNYLYIYTYPWAMNRMLHFYMYLYFIHGFSRLSCKHSEYGQETPQSQTADKPMVP